MHFPPVWLDCCDGTVNNLWLPGLVSKSGCHVHALQTQTGFNKDTKLLNSKVKGKSGFWAITWSNKQFEDVPLGFGELHF